MAKIKYQFYCKNEEEVDRALARIEKVLPKVRWYSGNKPTGWWAPNPEYPVWLFVWDDNDLIYRERDDYVYPGYLTIPDTVKIYQASSKTDIKKKLKKIHRDLPSVRWLSGDLPSDFIPSMSVFPIWLEVNRAGELGWRDMKCTSLSDPFYEKEKIDTTEWEDTATPATSDDPVDHPSHYTHGSIECIDAMVETQGKDAVQHFCVCNTFKYLWRWRGKNGMEDIKKAAWYLNKAIQLEESEEK